MIRLQPISTADVQHYSFMEELLIAAFPPEEYRELHELRAYTDQTENFYNNLLLDDITPIGFITYWDLGSFYYIEHFAINPSLRNGGYGKKALQHLCKKLQRPIVLEVEPPIEEMAQRRIKFYQRQGFLLWEKEYRQPPYKAGDDFLPLHLMVYGNLVCDKDFDEIKTRIHREVYKA
ncbi:MAG: GNAT family N-acetyltransferase [Bacteroides sp.]